MKTIKRMNGGFSGIVEEFEGLVKEKEISKMKPLDKFIKTNEELRVNDFEKYIKEGLEIYFKEEQMGVTDIKVVNKTYGIELTITSKDEYLKECLTSHKKLLTMIREMKTLNSSKKITVNNIKEVEGKKDTYFLNIRKKEDDYTFSSGKNMDEYKKDITDESGNISIDKLKLIVGETVKMFDDMITDPNRMRRVTIKRIFSDKYGEAYIEFDRPISVGCNGILGNTSGQHAVNVNWLKSYPMYDINMEAFFGYYNED